MMMKKTTSALAVAALLGTGAASAATFQVDENTSFSVGANIGYSYEVTEVSGESQSNFSTNSSDFRFGGEHVSDNGLTSLLYLEFDGFQTNKGSAQTDGGITTDQAYVGLRGDFGTVRLGSDLGTYGAVDGLKDIDQWHDVAGLSNDDDNSIRYDLPTMGNLSASVAANFYTDADGEDRSGTSLNASATYDLGAVAISGAVDNRGGLTDASETDGGDVDSPIYGVGAQFDVAGVDTRVTYEKSTDEAKEGSLMSLTGIYSLGNGFIYGTVQSVDGDSVDDTTALLGKDSDVALTADSDSTTQYTVGYGYSFTDNASIVFETADRGAKDDEGNGYSATVYFGF